MSIAWSDPKLGKIVANRSPNTPTIKSKLRYIGTMRDGLSTDLILRGRRFLFQIYMGIE